MKKLLVLALSALLVLGLASVSFAASVFSGEIDVAYRGATTNGTGSQSDYAFGKMVLSGKLGDDLTGTLVFKDQDTAAYQSNMGQLAVDEASLTFTEDFGTLKLGYYGWNKNPKDIVSAYRGDVKSQTTISTALAISDNISFGLAYAVKPTNTDGQYGADLGFTSDNFTFDVLYTNSGADGITNPGFVKTGIGAQAVLKLGEVAPYVQYENYNSGNAINTIVGFTYDSTVNPFYARAEVDLTSVGGVTEWGVRAGYKLADGAKVETQYNISATNDGLSTPLAWRNGVTTANWYLKVIAPF